MSMSIPKRGGGGGDDELFREKAQLAAEDDNFAMGVIDPSKKIALCQVKASKNRLIKHNKTRYFNLYSQVHWFHHHLKALVTNHHFVAESTFGLRSQLTLNLAHRWTELLHRIFSKASPGGGIKGA